ncbi:histidine-phosphotransfer domain, HPT domain-containing protein [Jimgerdemannia flammicorona]|uniref:Histidine-phosphotransfer domain, HPT domain-containing protein n=1 Tax=Jimgerdemannia flammicorona TaxID=994334 RepID=A0A433D6Q6_9FUNG|nr:histidine-phosphotransfer domain, HPT domain-containing protein [Jimgerdemannia flammicorona]
MLKLPQLTSSDENSAEDSEREQEQEQEEDLGLIDHTVFDQLTDMDDEEDHEFSKSIVWNYFEQAETTFEKMDAALDEKDLAELSRLGHFLKGSSAALGLRRVKATCEKMQNIGNLKDEEGINNIEEDVALESVTKLLKQVQEEYEEAEVYLRKFYEEPDGQ